MTLATARWSLPDDRERLLAFYRDHLERVVLPFWLGAPIDRTNGGVFSCLGNRDGRRVSGDKFTWSQGRFAWLMARAARMSRAGLIGGDPTPLLDIARHTVAFLDRHVFLDDGHCAYLLSEHGDKKEFLPGQGHDLSFFADCFVLVGFAEYARASGERAPLERALACYDGVRARLADGSARSEPYPLPPGCRAHAVPMIMLNVAQELAATLEAFAHARADEVRAHATADMDAIFETFWRPDHTLAEIVCEGGGERLLTRHITPGHAIESMWFVMQEAQRRGRPERIEAAVRVIERSFALGWDEEHGGLLRFVAPDGAPPQGRAEGRYERLILDSWDTKIWWPHSETLYATLLGHALSGDPAMLRIYNRTHAYTFATFPNPDPAVGEWIQIRDRQGRPLDQVVGLPVKDPYHILRNLLSIVALLTGGPEATF